MDTLFPVCRLVNLFCNLKKNFSFLTVISWMTGSDCFVETSDEHSDWPPMSTDADLNKIILDLLTGDNEWVLAWILS